MYNRSSQKQNELQVDDDIYNAAINKIQLFETRVRNLREGSSGVDADPDVLMAAASLAKEMEYSLTISTPSVSENPGKFIQQEKLSSTGSSNMTTSKRPTSSAAVKSARATYKRQMKLEQAAAAEAIEPNIGQETPTENDERTNNGDVDSSRLERNNND